MKGVGTRGDHHATPPPGYNISSAFDEGVPTAGRWKTRFGPSGRPLDIKNNSYILIGDRAGGATEKH